jgi:AraC-like DNA-binding protein
MKVSFIQVRAELKPFIQSIWVVESPGGMPASESNFAAPNGCPKLIVTLDNTIRSTTHGAALVSRAGGLFFVGNQESPTFLESPARRTRFAGIEFRPQGAYPVFGTPMIETTNRRFSADDVFANWGRDALEGVGNEVEISEKIDCLQHYLVASLRQGSRRNAAVDYCVDALQRTHGIVSIRELERQTGYSRRYLELLFKNHVGLPPKVLAGIFRFQKFYRKWATNCSFDELKEDLYEYYYDQSHFTKEFRKMTRFSPEQFTLHVENEFGRRLALRQASHFYKTLDPGIPHNRSRQFKEASIGALT